MRRCLSAIALFVLVLAASPMGSEAMPRCGMKGTNRGDFITGNAARNAICGRGGNDFTSGKEARDKLRGGPGNDTLVGGKARDRLFGRGGNDKLFAVDGRRGDRLVGGPGFDHCYGEKHDRFRGCERRITNNSPSYPLDAVLAMEKAYGRAVQTAQRRICLLAAVLCE